MPHGALISQVPYSGYISTVYKKIIFAEMPWKGLCGFNFRGIVAFLLVSRAILHNLILRMVGVFVYSSGISKRWHFKNFHTKMQKCTEVFKRGVV